MNSLNLRDRGLGLWRAWEAFWFPQRTPETLAWMRLLCGVMIAYMHLIWLLDLDAFLGPNAWVDRATMLELRGETYAWTYLWYIDSLPFLYLHEIVALLAGLAMAAGLLTRISVPMAWFLTLMVSHRMTGMMFGLDQVVMMICMYLMIAPCGAVLSLDHRLALRRPTDSFWFPSMQASSMTGLATRLLQVHLCIVYLFGGLSKLRGEMWQDGSALWFAAASYEYQSLDLTWLGRFPAIVATMTHGTLLWETFYCVLIWPRATRPWMLFIAVMVHGGIALFLGMFTFGFMMIIANMAFVDPETTRRICQVGRRWLGRASSST